MVSPAGDEGAGLVNSEARRSSSTREDWTPGVGAARVGMLLTAVGAVAIIAGRHEHVSAALSAAGALAATSRGGPGFASMRPGGGGNVSLTATSEAPSKTATSSSSDADGSVSATDGVDSSVVKNHCITTQLRLDVDDDISATLQDDAMPEICLAVSNEYERKLGIPIGDGKYGCAAPSGSPSPPPNPHRL